MWTDLDSYILNKIFSLIDISHLRVTEALVFTPWHCRTYEPENKIVIEVLKFICD